MKEKKRQQLVVLLTNKFRNKFNINNITEPDVDILIRDEIRDLLSDGKTYESNLNKLDKKLEVMIKDARAKRRTGQSNKMNALHDSLVSFQKKDPQIKFKDKLEIKKNSIKYTMFKHKKVLIELLSNIKLTN